MKNIILTVSMILLTIFCSYTFANLNKTDTDIIADAIRQGQVESLTTYLSSEVDMMLNNRQSRCTKEQAVMVLSEYFKENMPSNYVCDVHRNRVSGSVTTVDGKQYKVDYSLKLVNNQTFITGLYIY